MNWKSMFGLGGNDEVSEPLQAGPESAQDRGDEQIGAEIASVTPAAPEPPSLEWWWLAEHHGHPAFYLRTLMPGDFAPGRLPAPRHVRPLERPAEGLPAEVTCGTCGEVPRSEDLEPIERSTGQRGFLGEFRSGRARWPAPTKITSCWMCSGQAPAHTQVRLRDTDVLVCEGCAKHLDRRT